MRDMNYNRLSHSLFKYHKIIFLQTQKGKDPGGNVIFSFLLYLSRKAASIAARCFPCGVPTGVLNLWRINEVPWWNFRSEFQRHNKHVPALHLQFWWTWPQHFLHWVGVWKSGDIPRGDPTGEYPHVWGQVMWQCWVQKECWDSRHLPGDRCYRATLVGTRDISPKRNQTVPRHADNSPIPCHPPGLQAEESSAQCKVWPLWVHALIIFTPSWLGFLGKRASNIRKTWATF